MTPGNPKSEIRRPKETRNPKSESEVHSARAPSDFGLRISFGFRPSDFGFHRWRKLKNIAMQTFTFLSALLVLLPLALVFYHVVKSGIGSVNWDFFTKLPKPVGEIGGGMANAIVGTFVLLGLAALIGVPVGVLVGVCVGVVVGVCVGVLVGVLVGVGVAVGVLVGV